MKLHSYRMASMPGTSPTNWQELHVNDHMI